MANYLSFHAGVEGKVKKSDIKKMAGHTFRKTEKRYKSHGNKDIDTARTKYNIDWTLTNEPLDKLVEERLEREYKGKRALRKDAVVVREIIVQASPSVYEGLSLEEKRKKALQFTNDSLKWFRKEFGSKNVVAASVHMDETNPHTHFVIMPMTKDGRLSQKDFFKGPADLKRQHKEYREHMIKLGWDFEVENKYAHTVEGVPLKQFKETAEAVEKQRETYDLMIEELKGDRDVREEAIKAVYSDIYDGVLREEREALEREREAVEREREAVNAAKGEIESIFLALTKNPKMKYDKEIRDRVEREGLESVPLKEFVKTLEYCILDEIRDGHAKKLEDDLLFRKRRDAKRKTHSVVVQEQVENELELG